MRLFVHSLFRVAPRHFFSPKLVLTVPTRTLQSRSPRLFTLVALVTVALDAPASSLNESLGGPVSPHLESKPPIPEGHISPRSLSVLRALEDYVIDPLLTFCRALKLLVIFSPVLFASPVLLVHLISPDRNFRTTEWWYTLLVKQLERAGPTFIKLAQWAGSRRDLFPPGLCAAFGRLHSNGRAHSLAHTERVLRHAFGGQDWHTVLDQFDPTPIGVGAVAQVYRARLRSKNQDVVIKVLHPGVARAIRRDLAVMRLGARLLTCIPSWKWLSLEEEVLWFGNMMNQQIDLREEARNLTKFRENFADRQGVVFPKPYLNITSQEVLVEDFVEGLSLQTFLNHVKHQNGRTISKNAFDVRLARLGLDSFLNMLLLDNFVHADLHPGNIFVRLTPPSPSKSLFHRDSPPAEDSNTTRRNTLRRLKSLGDDGPAWNAALEDLRAQGWHADLTMIDAGLAISLTENNRRNFLDLFTAVATFDGYGAGKLMVERSASPDTAVDADGFALGVGKLVDAVKAQTLRLDGIVIGDVLSDILVSTRKHRVKLEGEFVNVILSILLLEGVGRTLDGDLDLFDAARPVLRRLGRKMGHQGDVPDVKLGLAMFKTWAYIEARDWTRTSGGESELLVRFDSLMPSC